MWKTLPENRPNIGDLSILQSACWISISEVNPCPMICPAVRLIVRVSISIVEVDLLQGPLEPLAHSRERVLIILDNIEFV